MLVSPAEAKLFALGSTGLDSILTFDMTTGTVSEFTELDLYYAPGRPAVGQDGSLYLAHHSRVGTAESATFVSRILPNHEVAWTTQLMPLMPDNPLVTTRPIALGNSDIVIVIANAVSTEYRDCRLLGFNAATGTQEWVVPVNDGQIVGGPAVRPDGSVVYLTNHGDPASPYQMSSRALSGTHSSIGIAPDVNGLDGITREGVVIAAIRTEPTEGRGGLVALDHDGSTIWQYEMEGVRVATISADGAIITHADSTITALDETNGSVIWSLSSPRSTSYISDVALTSDGEIVAVLGDGTVFVASD